MFDEETEYLSPEERREAYISRLDALGRTILDPGEFDLIAEQFGDPNFKKSGNADADFQHARARAKADGGGLDDRCRSLAEHHAKRKGLSTAQGYAWARKTLRTKED